MSESMRIVLNDCIVDIDRRHARATLLDWLRGEARLRGTKEGCAEGDCGACTVLWEHCDSTGVLRRSPINACLAMVGQLDGHGVRTVEGLQDPDGKLHPVQHALAASDGTQCGFCTPGFVMSMVAFAAGGEPAEPALVHDALAGNLCRCTGYRPIVEAAMATAQLAGDPLAAAAPATLALLQEVAAGGGTALPFLAPRSLAELLRLRSAHPEAVLLAGGTDLGLLASRDRKPPPALIHVAGVGELSAIEEDGETVAIGAAVPYEIMLLVVARHWPSFAALLKRLGSRQIRNLGTLGGNLGTASPIGDALPVLLALDATVVAHSLRGVRRIGIDDFFLGYRRHALAPDEVIVAVELPTPAPGEIFVCDKVSKRRDQDISAVCAAFRLRCEGEHVREARLAFGGMAATPVRAHPAEAALQGRVLSADSIKAAAAALHGELTPLDDLRGTASYRMAVAEGLLRRLWLRVTRPELPLEVEAL